MAGGGGAGGGGRCPEVPAVAATRWAGLGYEQVQDRPNQPCWQAPPRHRRSRTGQGGTTEQGHRGNGVACPRSGKTVDREALHSSRQFWANLDHFARFALGLKRQDISGACHCRTRSHTTAPTPQRTTHAASSPPHFTRIAIEAEACQGRPRLLPFCPFWFPPPSSSPPSPHPPIPSRPSFPTQVPTGQIKSNPLGAVAA